MCNNLLLKRREIFMFRWDNSKIYMKINFDYVLYVGYLMIVTSPFIITG